MNKAEQVLRTYVDFEDVNGSEPITLLPLTVIDAMEEYATQCQEDVKPLLNDLFSLWQSLAEVGEISVGKNFTKKYEELKNNLKK